MNAENSQYDIIIIGGGIVGLTMACLLAQHPLKIAVVESQRPSESTDNFDLRVSAINHASQETFSSIGAWQLMQAQRVSPYYKMSVWDAGSPGEIHFDCATVPADNLGYIIENRVMQSALLARLQQQEHVDTFCPATPSSWQEGRLTLADGHILTCRLLIGADGAHSFVRQQAHIETTGWDYHQTALVATVQTALPHEQTAWQRFLPTGPLAFLPLAEPHTSSIVWSTMPEKAEALLTMDEAAFKMELARAFDSRLGAITAVSERRAFPLRMSHAEQYVKSGVALVGDAAHTIHPLAGQGINLGILDATCLAKVIAEALSKNRDIGAYHTLRRYERWRKGHNMAMIAAMEAFKRVFEWEASPLRWARGIALQVGDQLVPLKNFFIRHAMGLA